jgi:valyl-tRNA synthetase
MNLGDESVTAWSETGSHATLGLPDRWILSRLHSAIEETRTAFSMYRLNDAATMLYRFIWDDFCDWYLELVKPTFYGEDETAKDNVRRTLVTVLDQTMRLLHPFMPFLTEEIWQALPMQRPVESIMIASYPVAAGAWRDAGAERVVGQLIGAVTAIRNIRSELGIAPTTTLNVRVSPDGQEDNVAALEGFIKALARVDSVEKLGDRPRPSNEPSAFVTGFGELFVPLSGSVDAAAVRDRLSRDLTKVEKELKGVDAKLGRPDFIERAPAEIVDKERQRAGELRDRKTVLEKHLATLGW